MNIAFDFSRGNRIYDALIDFDANHELHINLDDHKVITLNNVITFPGVVNSHDHLDFGLFPFLGNKIYSDYKEWGNDIHERNSEEIDATLAIPLRLRIRWSILKNLLNGATTIVHHGNHHDLIKSINYPVHLNYQYLHAPGTEGYWKMKLNVPLRSDVMIHIGEGTSPMAHKEIDELIRWNFLNRNLIGVHAIAIDEHQSKKFKAIVWCPDSNLKLYGETANVNALYDTTLILFGTDSTVSASWNMWEQLRTARSLKLLSDTQLYNILFVNPYKAFTALRNRSQIVARRKHDKVWDSLYATDPEDLLLVVNQHKVMLADNACFTLDQDNYSLISIGRSQKWVPKEWGLLIQDLERLNVTLPISLVTNS